MGASRNSVASVFREYFANFDAGSLAEPHRAQTRRCSCRGPEWEGALDFVSRCTCRVLADAGMLQVDEGEEICKPGQSCGWCTHGPAPLLLPQRGEWEE
jgi:hypothetical protein